MIKVLYVTYDRDGELLHADTIIAPNWTEACRMGMLMRHALTKTGITITWRKA